MDIITRKRLILASVAGLVLLIFLFLYNNSLLTIQSASDEEKTIYINKEGSSQNFTLNKGSKTMLLRRGSYSIEVVGPDKGSYYQKDLGFFWNNKLGVELRPQKSDSFLGNNKLSCAKDNGKTSLYYSCSPANFGFIELDAKKRTVDNQEEDLPNFTSVLKPYKNIFTNFKADKGSLLITQVNENGLVSDQPNSYSFGGEANDSTISVSQTGLISAYDSSSRSVLIFKDAADKQPAQVKLPGEAPPDELGIAINVRATSAYTYIVQAYDGSELDSEEVVLDDKAEQRQPKIIAVSNSPEHKITEQKLGKESILLSAEAGLEKNILLVLAGEQQGQVYRYNPEDGLDRLGAVKDTVQTVCWSGPNTFYYRADASKSVYEYSFEAKASYLVYADPINFIEDISCLGGQLYFSVSNDKVLEVGDLLHYKLNSQPFSGARLGTLLPIYYTFEGDTIRVSESRGGVIIDLDYDSQGNGPPAKNVARQAVVDILNDAGVNTSQLKINFRF